MNISFVTVYTDRMEESIEFYTKIFSFKVVRSYSPKPGMDITFLEDDNGAVLEFIQEESTPKYEGKGISIGFQVNDIRRTYEHLKKHNVVIVNGPIEMPNGVKLMQAIDLNGLELGFVEVKKQ